MNLTVIVPTKDRPDRLLAALVPIFAQEGVEFDVLVKDASEHPANLPEDPRLTHLRLPDTCIADAVNQAAQYTDADVLHIAQDDNLMCPGTLRSAMDAMEDGAAWTIGAMRAHAEDGTTWEQWPEPWDTTKMLTVGNLVSEPTVFFRRDVFAALGGMDTGYRWCQDYELWTRIAARYGPPVYRDHIDSDYYFWPGSISRMHEPAMWEETHRIQAAWRAQA